MPQESTSKPKSKFSKTALKQIRVGVLAGGNSSERPISLRSGKAVLRGLRKAGFKAVFIDPKNSVLMEKQLRHIDAAFLALHGRGGEDGSIQQFLEEKGIPYIGSDARASWRAFDKNVSKRIFIKHGVPTPPGVTVNKENWLQRLEKFPTPFFIKPAREGSSIGAFSVSDFKTHRGKIGKAVQAFQDLIAEKKIEGREFTVGILGKKALPVVEMRPKNKFYDYHAKYTKGMTDYLVPAPIAPILKRKLQVVAAKAHRVLGLRDFSRVDVMVDRAGQPYVLEANSIPGFTELSLLPKAAQAAGISFEQLCARLVEMAWRRRLRRPRGQKEAKKEL